MRGIVWPSTVNRLSVRVTSPRAELRVRRVDVALPEVARLLDVAVCVDDGEAVTASWAGGIIAHDRPDHRGPRPHVRGRQELGPLEAEQRARRPRSPHRRAAAGNRAQPRAVGGGRRLAHDLGTVPSPDNPRPPSTTCSPRATPGTPTASRGTRRPATTSGSTSTGCTPRTWTPCRTCSCGGRCTAAGPRRRCAATGARQHGPVHGGRRRRRGVLLDVPHATGRRFLDTGEVVTVDDLEAAERSAGGRGAARRHPVDRLGAGGAAAGADGFRRVRRAPSRVPPVAV